MVIISNVVYFSMVVYFEIPRVISTGVENKKMSILVHLANENRYTQIKPLNENIKKRKVVLK